MTGEAAMTVAVMGENAQAKDLVPALKALFGKVRALENERLAQLDTRMTVAMPTGTVALAVHRILEELDYATKKFGPIKSPHEGLGVLTEEYLELVDWIRLKDEKRVPAEGYNEAKQIAAVCIRFMIDCCEDRTIPRFIPHSIPCGIVTCPQVLCDDMVTPQLMKTGPVG